MWGGKPASENESSEAQSGAADKGGSYGPAYARTAFSMGRKNSQLSWVFSPVFDGFLKAALWRARPRPVISS